jgi:formylglycine-generating enzyme required for sulfatase activity
MSKGRRYAVLIGSSRFDKEPNLSQLKCPENDVDGMREILAATELGAFEEPFVFKNAESYVVMHRIEETLSEATGDDQLLIYYSGHGKMDLPGRLYLTTTNTEVKKLVTTSIPVETLRLLIGNSSCRKIMLILDCCYGGAAGRSFISIRGGIDDNLQELARGNGVYILTASTASQTAQEREGDDYGLLTKYIISGIKQGEADVNDDGYVSMDDLYSYVFAKVKSEGFQEPMRWALNVKGEDLIIARAAQTFSAERLKTFKEMIMKVEQDLDEDVFEQAYRVIRENQPKRDKEQFALLEDLCEDRLSIGRFNGKWIKLSVTAKPQTGAEFAIKPPPLSAELEKWFIEEVNGVSLEMILIPGGMFRMGSPEGKGYDIERPEHVVGMGYFYIGKYPITQAQWEAVMGGNPSRFRGNRNLPVENVSWSDAKKFCEKVSRMTGREYRLPSEAEWEYACRAGTTGDHAGKLDEMAWYGKNSGEKTHPVGKKLPNAYGLYDMHGNVWEWCEDIWHGDYKAAPIDGAWLSGGDSSLRIQRGGCWADSETSCRSANRGGGGVYDRGYYCGFRVACSPGGQPVSLADQHPNNQTDQAHTDEYKQPTPPVQSPFQQRKTRNHHTAGRKPAPAPSINYGHIPSDTEPPIDIPALTTEPVLKPILPPLIYFDFEDRKTEKKIPERELINFVYGLLILFAIIGSVIGVSSFLKQKEEKNTLQKEAQIDNQNQKDGKIAQLREKIAEINKKLQASDKPALRDKRNTWRQTLTKLSFRLDEVAEIPADRSQQIIDACDEIGKELKKIEDEVNNLQGLLPSQLNNRQSIKV